MECLHRLWLKRFLICSCVACDSGLEIPSIPIDPFKLMREYGIVYQFMEFEDLEGIYLVPEDDNDIPLVGINLRGRLPDRGSLLHMNYATI